MGRIAGCVRTTGARDGTDHRHARAEHISTWVKVGSPPRGAAGRTDRAWRLDAVVLTGSGTKHATRQSVCQMDRALDRARIGRAATLVRAPTTPSVGRLPNLVWTGDSPPDVPDSPSGGHAGRSQCANRHRCGSDDAQRGWGSGRALVGPGPQPTAPRLGLEIYSTAARRSWPRTTRLTGLTRPFMLALGRFDRTRCLHCIQQASRRLLRHARRAGKLPWSWSPRRGWPTRRSR